MTCICVTENKLFGRREPPKVGEVFVYQLMDNSQYTYHIYDSKTGAFLWNLTDRSFYKIFKDLQEHRQEQLDEILK